MSTLTSRVGLYKPAADGTELVNVVTDLNNNLDKIDSWLGATICTSGTRPASPWSGQIIRESDTAKMYVWSGSAWVQLLHGTANFDQGITVSSGNYNATLGAFNATRSGATSDALTSKITTDTEKRLIMDANGKFLWGPGGVTPGDTSLYRSAANTLKTDDALEVAGTLNATGAATLGSTLAVTGNTTLSGDLMVSGIGKSMHPYVTVDETRVSTTTLTSSTYLTATLAINAVYWMQIWLPFTGPAGNSLKWGWTFPTGMTMRYGGIYYTGTMVGRNYIQTDTNLTTSTEGTSISAVLNMSGMVFMSSTAGSLTFQWAQGSSSATAVTIFKGGYLHLTRVA